MTPRQANLYRFIAQRIQDTGQAPTYAEMMCEIGARWTGQVAALVERLIERGHLIRDARQERGLRLPLTRRSEPFAIALRVEDGALVRRFVQIDGVWKPC